METTELKKMENIAKLLISSKIEYRFNIPFSANPYFEFCTIDCADKILLLIIKEVTAADLCINIQKDFITVTYYD
jgi:hypothetical protein